MNVEHRDAFDALRDLPADHAHAALVDYPWEFSIQNGTGRYEPRSSAGQGASRNRDADDALYEMEPADRLGELFSQLARVLVDGAWILCFADDNFQKPLRDALRESPLTLRRNWAWAADTIGMGCYGRVNHYPIPTATNGETDRWVRDRGTLYAGHSRVSDFQTGKPVSLVRDLLAPPVLVEGERLVEPFCGSGPGAFVAATRGLDYWGCDVNAEAVERTRERLRATSLIAGYDERGNDAHQRGLAAFTDGGESV